MQKLHGCDQNLCKLLNIPFPLNSLCDFHLAIIIIYNNVYVVIVSKALMCLLFSWHLKLLENYADFCFADKKTTGPERVYIWVAQTYHVAHGIHKPTYDG